MKIVIYGLNSEIMGQKVTKMAKIGENVILQNNKNPKMCSLDHFLAKICTRTVTPYYLEIVATDF